MSVMILTGDARKVLPTLPDCSVHCCVTSPPYFGLRSYNGGDAEIGLEQTPDAFVTKLVDVFREVKRVLRDDGTLWLNLGDSYASNPASGGEQSSKMTGGQHKRTPKTKYQRPPGLKPKDLIGIPWRVAFALQADGWYLRQDIIWHKPNPMPESVTDRCTKAHEYIFLLAKSERYYFDSEAMKEPSAGWPVGGAKTRGKTGYASASGAGKSPQRDSHGGLGGDGETRNRRSVWTVTTKPYKGAHFATFPPALITPCILAGCPQGGTVLDPFGGSGTTGDVAEGLGRNSVLVELNPDYVSLAKKRTAQMGLFLCQL